MADNNLERNREATQKYHLRNFFLKKKEYRQGNQHQKQMNELNTQTQSIYV